MATMAVGGGAVTDPSEESKGNDESDDWKGTEEPELRTDGGEAAAHRPGFGPDDTVRGPTMPPQPGVPSFGDRTDPGETSQRKPKDTRFSGDQVRSLQNSVESHFTPEELDRLRKIAARANTKSAWVSNRLFQNPEE